MSDGAPRANHRVPPIAGQPLPNASLIKGNDAAANLAQQRRLPPLNALRAFEAAARLGGFNAAGTELNVSANAVGRLVKLLEDSLGLPLFRRMARGVVLTDAGARYLAGVSALLDQLAEATTDLQRREKSRLLKVSAAPSLVSRWLIPRLCRLTERHPDLDVRLTATVARADFTREDIDVAIRVGTGCYEGMRSDFLMHSDFFPVCAPQLLQQAPPLRHPADLADHVLLHDQCPCSPRLPDRLDWRRWLAATSVTNVDAERGLLLPAHGTSGCRGGPGGRSRKFGVDRRRSDLGPPRAAVR